MNSAIGTGRRLRGVLAGLLVLSMLASLAVAEAASAQRALSEERATATAERLMDRQLRDRERNLVEARISVGERVNRNVFRFLYDDLNREGIVCAGIVDVRLVPPGGTTVRARFVDTNCERPGDEALSYRTVARAGGEAFVRQQPKMLRAIRRYVRSIEPCEALEVPGDRQDEATLLLTTGLTKAAVRPVARTLDDYASTLESIGAVDPQLAKGAAAWRDFVDGYRSYPALAPSACAVLAEWAGNGFTDATAPVDFEALRALTERLEADGRELRRTSRYLARLGIDPLTAVEFSLDDLVGAIVAPTDLTGEGASRILARR